MNGSSDSLIAVGMTPQLKSHRSRICAQPEREALMQEFAKSLGSFTWAMSLFGMQQITAALGATSRRSESREAVEALQQVTRASLDHCGSTARQTFDMGDKIQRDLVDLICRFIPMSNGEDGGSGCACPSFTDLMQPATNMFARATEAASSASVPEEEFGWGPVPPAA